MKTTVCTSSPGRVCFSGEYLDIFMQAVIACAIDTLRVYVQIKETSAGKTQVTSHDFFNDIKAEFDVHMKIRYTNGPLDYVRAVCRVLLEERFPLDNVEIEIKSTLPPGAGLSSSAALCVALTGALSQYFSLGLSIDHICAFAHRAESKSLAVGCGQMDPYSSGIGGLQFLDCSTEPPVVIGRFNTRSDVAIVIGSTHLPRNIRDSMSRMKQRIAKNEPLILEFVHRTLLSLKEMSEILHQPDWDPQVVGKLLTTFHGYLRVYAQVSNEHIERYVHAALDAGAFGAKLTGATGTGGSMFALTTPENAQSVADAITQSGGHSYITKMNSSGFTEEDVSIFQTVCV